VGDRAPSPMVKRFIIAKCATSHEPSMVKRFTIGKCPRLLQRAIVKRFIIDERARRSGVCRR
jgi:hypothetical protein